MTVEEKIQLRWTGWVRQDDELISECRYSGLAADGQEVILRIEVKLTSLPIRPGAHFFFFLTPDLGYPECRLEVCFESNKSDETTGFMAVRGEPVPGEATMLNIIGSDDADSMTNILHLGEELTFVVRDGDEGVLNLVLPNDKGFAKLYAEVCKELYPEIKGKTDQLFNDPEGFAKDVIDSASDEALRAVLEASPGDQKEEDGDSDTGPNSSEKFSASNTGDFPANESETDNESALKGAHTVAHPLADVVEKAIATCNSLRGLPFAMQCALLREKIDNSDLFVACYDNGGEPGLYAVRGQDFLIDISKKRAPSDLKIDAIGVRDLSEGTALAKAFWRGTPNE